MSRKQHLPRLVFLVTEDHYFCSHRWDLAKDAQKQGYEVHVVCNVSQDGEKIRHGGFRLHRLYHLQRTQLNPFRDLMALWEIVRIFRKIKPHVVHNIAWKPTLYGSLAALITRVPRIINMLGGLGFTFTSTSALAVSAREVITFMGRRILSKTRCQIVVQNEDNRNVLLERGLAKPEQVHIVRGSGIDTEYYHPAPTVPKDPTAPITFVCACRLIREKGLYELAAAMEMIRNQPELLEGKTFRMVLYGAIDESYPNKVQAEDLLTWQARGWIEWKGFSQDMRTVYQQCDGVVLPSYAEGMPKALLEAAACGKPMITTDVSGCRDLVQHKYNGLLVPPQNALALSEAILELLHQSELREKMGANARLFVMQHFARNLIHEQIFALYEGYNMSDVPPHKEELVLSVKAQSE